MEEGRTLLFKTILAAVRTSPLLVALIAVAALFDLLFHYLSALSYKYLIDQALIPRNASVLAVIVGTLLAFGIANVAAGIGGDYAKARLGSRLVFEYRMKLFRHMQAQSHRFYERFRTGDLLARHAEDVPNVQAAVVQTLSAGLVNVSSVVVGLAILFATEWRLTLVAVSGSVLLLLPYRLLKSGSLSLNEDYLRHLERYTGSLNENIKGYKVVRGFDLRETMLARTESSLRAMMAIGVRRSFVNANLNRLPLLAISVVTAILLAYGSYLTFRGSLSIGSFIAYNSIFITVGQSLFGVTALVPSLLTAGTSLRRLKEVLDWQPDVAENGTRELPALRREIAFRGVTFAYRPGTPVLEHLDLAIPATGYTSIVGASGSGKSTVLQLLLRFEDPSGGAVLYDGEDIREADYGSLLKQVGIVFQDTILFEGTIRDNIAIGKPGATDGEIEKAARAAGIHETIVRMPDGYGTAVLHQGDNLSGGQRQRVALARALVREPRILFLDEATSALDPETERAVNETVRALSSERAVVSVTHRLAYAAQSDRIVVLDGGRVAESGSHRELMGRSGIYRRMWDKQQGFVLSGGGAGAQVGMERLGRFPFFRGIEPEALQEIARLFVTEKFDAGVRAVRQGEEGDKLYILVRGKVEVVLDGDEDTGKSKRLAVLEDGDHFGEIALLRGVPRTASVVTLTPCVCLALFRQDFLPLLSRYPSIREALEASLQIRNQRSAVR